MADTKKCRSGCIYWQAYLACCGYWEIEDRLRGCPPGDKCTKYKRGKRPRLQVNVAGRDWNTDRAKELYELGYSDRAIAAFFNVHTDTIRYMREKYWKK